MPNQRTGPQAVMYCTVGLEMQAAGQFLQETDANKLFSEVAYLRLRPAR